MTTIPDPYKVLGVPASATDQEIKTAYRRKASQYHPDHNPNNPSAASALTEVKDAYEILGDPIRKESYDTKVADGKAKQQRKEKERGERESKAANRDFSAFGGKEATTSQSRTETPRNSSSAEPPRSMSGSAPLSGERRAAAPPPASHTTSVSTAGVTELLSWFGSCIGYSVVGLLPAIWVCDWVTGNIHLDSWLITGAVLGFIWGTVEAIKDGM